MDSKKLEYRSGTTNVGLPSSQAFGLGGPPYSNFLASTVPFPSIFELYKSSSKELEGAGGDVVALVITGSVTCMEALYETYATHDHREF